MKNETKLDLIFNQVFPVFDLIGGLNLRPKITALPVVS